MSESSGYGHDVSFINYRHQPEHVATAIDDAGFDVLVRLTRAAEGRESSASLRAGQPPS